MVKISVVMTSYNHEKYISASIESVLNQTFKDLELIVIDDASTDSSRDIILQYARKDDRVRYIFNEYNRGIARSTNAGFDAARGELIAYIQSDDLWLPENMEKQLEMLKGDYSKIAWSDGIVIDSEGKRSGQLVTQRRRIADRKRKGQILDSLLISNFIYVQSVLLKKNYAQETRFDERLCYGSDYKFLVELADKYEFIESPEPLWMYRVHGSNASSANEHIWKKDGFRFRKYVLRKHRDRLNPKLLAKYYYRIGQYLAEKKHQKVSRRYFWEAVKKNCLKTTYMKALLKSSLG